MVWFWLYVGGYLIAFTYISAYFLDELDDGHTCGFEYALAGLAAFFFAFAWPLLIVFGTLLQTANALRKSRAIR